MDNLPITSIAVNNKKLFYAKENVLFVNDSSITLEHRINCIKFHDSLVFLSGGSNATILKYEKDFQIIIKIHLSDRILDIFIDHFILILTHSGQLFTVGSDLILYQFNKISTQTLISGGLYKAGVVVGSFCKIIYSKEINWLDHLYNLNFLKTYDLLNFTRCIKIDRIINLKTSSIISIKEKYGHKGRIFDVKYAGNDIVISCADDRKIRKNCVVIYENYRNYFYKLEVEDDYIYAFNKNGDLSILKSGVCVFEMNFGMENLNSMCVNDGILYIGTNSGHLYEISNHQIKLVVGMPFNSMYLNEIDCENWKNVELSDDNLIRVFKKDDDTRENNSDDELKEAIQIQLEKLEINIKHFIEKALNSIKNEIGQNKPASEINQKGESNKEICCMCDSEEKNGGFLVQSDFKEDLTPDELKLLQLSIQTFDKNKFKRKTTENFIIISTERIVIYFCKKCIKIIKIAATSRIFEIFENIIVLRSGGILINNLFAKISENKITDAIIHDEHLYICDYFGAMACVSLKILEKTQIISDLQEKKNTIAIFNMDKAQKNGEMSLFMQKIVEISTNDALFTGIKSSIPKLRNLVKICDEIFQTTLEEKLKIEKCIKTHKYDCSDSQIYREIMKIYDFTVLFKDFNAHCDVGKNECLLGTKHGDVFLLDPSVKIYDSIHIGEAIVSIERINEVKDLILMNDIDALSEISLSIAQSNFYSGNDNKISDEKALYFVTSSNGIVCFLKIFRKKLFIVRQKLFNLRIVSAFKFTFSLSNGSMHSLNSNFDFDMYQTKYYITALSKNFYSSNGILFLRADSPLNSNELQNSNIKVHEKNIYKILEIDDSIITVGDDHQIVKTGHLLDNKITSGVFHSAQITDLAYFQGNIYSLGNDLKINIYNLNLRLINSLEHRVYEPRFLIVKEQMITVFGSSIQSIKII